MPLTNKSGWLEALRSGRYLQGFHHLRSANNEYCCLGVYCEVLQLQPMEPDDEDEGYYYPITSDQGRNTLTDCEYPDGFGGLTDEQAADLASMNDSLKSFSSIADWIEENLE